MTTSLPANLQIKAGTFRSQFGRNNSQHLHLQNFTRRPLMTALLFGADGFRGPGRAGVGAAAAALVRDALRRGVQHRGARGADDARRDVRRRRANDAREPDLHRRAGAVLRARRSDSLLLGANFATGRLGRLHAGGPCDPAIAGRAAQLLYGGDLYFKWKPAERRRRPTRACSGRRSSSPARSPTGGPTEGAGYTEPVVQIARRFSVGGRFD